MENNGVELHNVILQIPKNASEITMTAKILEDDKVIEAQGRYDIAMLFQARKDFLDYVSDGDDYNATYLLTDKGKAYLKELEHEGRI